MALIEIEFDDGRLTCQGTMRYLGRMHSASPSFVKERASTVTIDIESGTITGADHQERRVEPGVYTVSRDGLTRAPA